MFLVLALCAIVFGSLVYYQHEQESVEAENAEPLIGVHIKGSVNASGYYEVPYGTRVKDLGDIAGGFADNVDLNGVNLAQYVEDGQEIYFPYRGSADNGALNLNTATAEQFMTLDGIGEVSAEKLVSYRNEVGRFTSIEEVKEILGKSKYESIREKLYID